MIARARHVAVLCALALAACKEPNKDARARAVVGEEAPAASTQSGPAQQGGPQQDAPPQSVPPQSVPPQSVPPQSVPPQSVPPQSVQPAPRPSTVSRCVAGWSPANAANSPLRGEGDCWTKPSKGTSLNSYPKGVPLCVRDQSKQTVAGPFGSRYDMVEVEVTLRGATQATRCWTECKFIAVGNAECGS